MPKAPFCLTFHVYNNKDEKVFLDILKEIVDMCINDYLLFLFYKGMLDISCFPVVLMIFESLLLLNGIYGTVQ